MADFQTDVQSIQYQVVLSKNEDDARARYASMEGIDLPKESADLVFEHMLKAKFGDKPVIAKIKELEHRIANINKSEVLKKLEKDAEVDADVTLLHRGSRGSYHEPPEGPEVDVDMKHTSVMLPNVTHEEFQVLPKEFELEVGHTYWADDHLEIGLLLTFKIHVTGFEDGALEYKDECVDWEYQ